MGPGLVLQEGPLFGRLPENEGLTEVGDKLQNEILANLTVYPEWALNIHFLISLSRTAFCSAKFTTLIPKVDLDPLILSKASML